MKTKRSFSILTSISLAITSFLFAPKEKTSNHVNLIQIEPVAATTVKKTPVGRILSVQNDRKIKAGTLIYSDDILQPSPGADITALCYASGETWQVSPGNSPVGAHCPQPASEVICPENKNCYDPDPRGPENDPNLPYIISLYETDIINARPRISWHAVSGITSYSVSIIDITEDGLNWERAVTNPPKSVENEITWDYPSDVPALVPGHEYKLTIEVKTEGSQNYLEASESTFAMLKPETIKQVQDTINLINSLNISKEEKYLQDLYSVYQKNHLISDIRNILESLVKDGSQIPQTYRKLGDIYLKQNLWQLAKTRYKTAVKLAKINADEQELELAETRLNQVNQEIKKLGLSDDVVKKL